MGKGGRAREFKIEDQYSPDRTKGSRSSRDAKTHARNADGNSFVSQWESLENRWTLAPVLSCSRKP